MIIPAISPLVFIAGILTAIAASMVGNILLIRKMVLVSDSMPHIALPGIALGVLYHFNPLYGAMAFLAVAVFVIWLTENKTSLPTESIIGVLFVTSLALGAVLIPEEGLLEAFFGSIESIGRYQALAQIIGSLLVITAVSVWYKSLVLSSIAPELARSININTRAMQLFFLFLVAVVVAIGINFVGVLLMSSLLIIPAVSARNFTSSMKQFFLISGGLATLSMVLGLSSAGNLHLAPGILIVFFSALSFVVSLCVSIVRGAV